MTCAYCNSSRIYRSHRKSPVDLLLSALLIYPYRCQECKHRSYTRSRSKTVKMTEKWTRVRLQLFVYSFVLLFCLVLVYFFIQEKMPVPE